MKVADFEKVSLKQFNSDVKSLLSIEGNYYDNVKIPFRATKGSAGYDFYCPIDITIKPGEIAKIPTGIRCKIDDGYVLQIYPRSSLGFKYQMSLLNTVGIIDSDYYNAENEGHIIVGIVNKGSKDIVISCGDRFVQGVFYQYFEANDYGIQQERCGGFGSTN